MAQPLNKIWLNLQKVQDITKESNFSQAEFLNSNKKLVKISLELWKSFKIAQPKK